MFTDSSISLIGNSNQNLAIQVNQSTPFNNPFYINSRTKNSTESASIPVNIQVCGAETIKMQNTSIKVKKMQNTGKVFLSEGKFSKEFESSNVLCPITSYELVYSNKEDQSPFIEMVAEKEGKII